MNVQTHHIDTFQNQDKVLKESLDLYKGESLDFLDEEFSDVVTDILSTELTETTTQKAYADHALKLMSNTGLHTEYESHISQDDMLRILAYNTGLSRTHGIPFTTVIITTHKPSVTSYSNPSVTFTPKIINLKERDADQLLHEIDKKLKAGDYSGINTLEIIYLPLYGSKSGKTTAQLLDTAIKLVPEVAKDDRAKRRKLHSLMTLLANTFISEEEFNRIMEENMRILDDSPLVVVLENRGMNRGRSTMAIEIAQNMLRRGRNYQEISEDTGLDVDRIAELDNELQARVV